MATNVGRTDQLIRIFLGIPLLALGLFPAITGAWAIAAVGLFDMWVNFRRFFKRKNKNQQ